MTKPTTNEPVYDIPFRSTGKELPLVQAKGKAKPTTIESIHDIPFTTTGIELPLYSPISQRKIKPIIRESIYELPVTSTANKLPTVSDTVLIQINRCLSILMKSCKCICLLYTAQDNDSLHI